MFFVSLCEKEKFIDSSSRLRTLEPPEQKQNDNIMKKRSLESSFFSGMD